MSDKRSVHNPKASKKKAAAASKARLAENSVHNRSKGGYYTSSVYKMPRGANLEKRLKEIVKRAKETDHSMGDVFFEIRGLKVRRRIKARRL
jgi:hypothetical protein